MTKTKTNKSAASSDAAASTGKVTEYVRTADGELIPRGPIGERSVYTTPKGRIINLDMEGLPVQLGPKPEVIQVKEEAPVATPAPAEPPVEEQKAAVITPTSAPNTPTATPAAEPQPAAQSKTLEAPTVPKTS